MLDFGFYNMDCMDGMRDFPDKYFDLAIVDPPYGINVGKASMGAGGGVAPHRSRSAANLRGGRTLESEARNHSGKILGGGLLSRPKFIRRSMIAAHRTPHISRSSTEYQRRQSYGAATISSTTSGRRSALSSGTRKGAA